MKKQEEKKLFNYSNPSNPNTESQEEINKKKWFDFDNHRYERTRKWGYVILSCFNKVIPCSQLSIAIFAGSDSGRDGCCGTRDFEILLYKMVGQKHPFNIRLKDKLIIHIHEEI